MSSSFLGSWLVSEYVYNADGSFAGINYQRRILETLASGRIRVTQVCDPSPELASHPLGRFRGEWVFELSTDGRARRYHGPDVIGTGLTWGNGVMTGRGLWPHLGFNFTSFGILATPDRQLTGGKFFTAGEMKANIVGIAVNESQAKEYPLFEQASPAEISTAWIGTRRVVLADGRVDGEISFTRRYQESAWHEPDQIFELSATRDNGIQKIESSTTVGLIKRTGTMLEAELVDGPGKIIEMMEVFDPVGKNLVGLRKFYGDHVLEKVEVLFLQPA